MKDTLYRRIFSDMLKKIESGEYSPGDKLPAEKEISEKYNVSRITSKKAMDLLAQKGYIERIPGSGSYIIETEDLVKKTSNSNIIGLVFDSFGIEFGSELLRSIELECSRRNYSLLFRCTYGNVEAENKAIQQALSLGVKGLIIMCTQGETYNRTILELVLRRFPMILVDREMKGIQVPCVKTDNYSASRELTNVLIEKGHKRILLVTHANLNTSTISERYNGFSDSILEAEGVSGYYAQIDSFSTTPENIDDDYDNYDINELKKVILKNEGCTAYITTEHRLAVMFKKVIDNLQYDVEIVTFDGLNPMYQTKCEFIHIKQNEFAMGIHAVSALDDIINGGVQIKNIDVPYEIIVPTDT